VTAGIGIAKTAVEFDVSSKSGTTGSGAGARSGAGTGTASGRGTAGGSTSVVYVNVYGPVTSRRVHEEVVALERDAGRAY
jgi:hypothetical protein